MQQIFGYIFFNAFILPKNCILFLKLSNGFLYNKSSKVLYKISPLFPEILLNFSKTLAILCFKLFINNKKECQIAGNR